MWEGKGDVGVGGIIGAEEEAFGLRGLGWGGALRGHDAPDEGPLIGEGEVGSVPLEEGLG